MHDPDTNPFKDYDYACIILKIQGPGFGAIGGAEAEWGKCPTSPWN